MAPSTRPLRLGAWRLRRRGAIPDAWIAALVEGLPDLDPTVRGRDKYFGVHALPPDLPWREAFVKVYPPTEFHRRKREPRWRRLLPRYAATEGRGYLRFEKAGLRAPALLAWGEEWRGLLRDRGLVVTERIDARPVREILAEGRDEALVEDSLDALAAIHRAGLVHGGGHLRNFLATRPHVTTIDLAGVRRATRAGRARDLLLFLVSLAEVIPDPAFAAKLLTRYAAGGLALPESAERILWKVEAHLTRARRRARGETMSAREFKRLLEGP